jgi:DME family drug/metabolite transporter
MTTAAPPEPQRQSWQPIAVLLLVAALWSTNGPLIKLITAESPDREPVPAITIACLRSLLGGLVFLPWLLRRGKELRRAHPGWAVGSVCCFTLMTVAFVLATTGTAAANAIVLQYTSPLWVFLLSPLLLGERPRLADGAVLLIAMVGVVVIFVGNAQSASGWLIVALLSGLGYGALTVTLRGLRAVPPAVVAAMNALGSGLILVPAVLIWGTFMLDAWQATLLVIMALLQFTLPYLLFSWALQRIAAYQAALIVLIEAVLNPTWTWLAIGEPVPPATLAGGPLILVGVALWIVLSARRAPVSAPALESPTGVMRSPAEPNVNPEEPLQ